jgi:hypothetical protein
MLTNVLGFLAFRTIGALPVLRWPLAGGLLAVAVDMADLWLVNYVVTGPLPDYQALDKLADLAYMSTFLVVAAGWQRPERAVAQLLFAYRIIGVALFVATGWRLLMMLFPNLFEAWFLLVAARDRLAADWRFTPRRTARALSVLALAKLPQEFLLHIDRRLDRYVLRDVIDSLLGR